MRFELTGYGCGSVKFRVGYRKPVVGCRYVYSVEGTIPAFAVRADLLDQLAVTVKDVDLRFRLA